MPYVEIHATDVAKALPPMECPGTGRCVCVEHRQGNGVGSITSEVS